MRRTKIELRSSNKFYGLIRVALAYQNGQGRTAVVISCFPVCHLVVGVQFLRV